ncbi:hypothetical protein BDQ17DRAFT_1330408 [Cyathus striatus]|nr:hypothetical protein BDQ17DRAFT_1330408 [Cyathus striatus]
MFLDLEAQVASGSEDENDEEEPNKFIVDSEENDDEDPNIPVCQLELACSYVISRGGAHSHTGPSSTTIVSKHNVAHCGQVARDWSLYDTPFKVKALNLEDLKKFTKIFSDIDQFHIRPAPNIMWDSYFGNVGASYTPYKHTWIDVVQLPRVEYTDSSK